ncbi:unnamed protein product [Periconia digitata]|uniref:Uncharacterized protein n=1 Tax=Periconia digitata TaxID=1303443 RepID=A0A9W4U9Z6_9PLEO|nr:unnamed protein product [Periconia digitata]
MFCTVELYDRDFGYTWYCCNCSNGPMGVKINTHCTRCDHGRCGSSTASALRQNSQPAAGVGYAAKDHAASSLADLNAKGSPGICSEGLWDGDEPPSSSSDASSSDSDFDANDGDNLRFDAEAQATAADYERNTQVVLDALKAAPLTCAAPPTHQAGGSSRPRAGSAQFPKDRREKVSQSKKSRLGHQKKDHHRKIDEGGSEAHPQGTKVARRLKSKQDTVLYACPFFKNNPHRYRHVRSCNKPWTIEGLRNHLTREDSPHNLRLLDNDHQALQQPVEGIGERLRNDILVLSRGSGTEVSAADELWWFDVNALLFGEEERYRPSLTCSYDPGDIDRSNDWNKQQDYAHRVIQSLERDLPIEFAKNIVLYHLRSVQEASAKYLADEVIARFEHRVLHDFIVQPRDVVDSRRRGRGSGSNNVNDEMNPRGADIMDMERVGEQQQNSVIFADELTSFASSDFSGQPLMAPNPADHNQLSGPLAADPYPWTTSGLQYPETQSTLFDPYDTDMLSMGLNEQPLQMNNPLITAPSSFMNQAPPSPDWNKTEEETRFRAAESNDADIPANLHETVNPEFGSYAQGPAGGYNLMEGYSPNDGGNAACEMPEVFDYDPMMCDDAMIERFYGSGSGT